MLNLASLLEETTAKYTKRTAIVFNDTRISYQELNGAVNKISNGLMKLGLKKGDKIALSCPNLPYFPMVYYAILKIGATVVPLNVLLKAKEIAYHLTDSQAKAYFCFEGTSELPMAQMGIEGFNEVNTCEHFIVMNANPSSPSPFENSQTLTQLMVNESPIFEMVDTSSEETAVILYTSGTTGQPKGAELSHSNMFLNARLSDNQLFNLQEHEVFLITLPLFHSFGQTVLMNMGFYIGGTIVLMPRFDPEQALYLMEKEQVSFFGGVPTMYWALLNYPEASKFDLEKIAKNLTTSVSGGSPLPVEVIKAFEKRFDVKILEGYGLSETSPVASFNHFDRPTKVGSVGQSVWGVKIKIVNESGEECSTNEQGEILIKGHNVMKGYFNRPEATGSAIKNGWLHTGDIGKLDEDNYIYITDRLKDMIIRGGFNIYPREIEEVLMTHPAISLVAVIGVPHERHGEEVKAFIILKDGQDVSSESIINWAKENMADYKYPRIVEIKENLPMTATGKILKRELR